MVNGDILSNAWYIIPGALLLLPLRLQDKFLALLSDPVLFALFAFSAGYIVHQVWRILVYRCIFTQRPLITYFKNKVCQNFRITFSKDDYIDDIYNQVYYSDKNFENFMRQIDKKFFFVTSFGTIIVSSAFAILLIIFWGLPPTPNIVNHPWEIVIYLLIMGIMTIIYNYVNEETNRKEKILVESTFNGNIKEIRKIVKVAQKIDNDTKQTTGRLDRQSINCIPVYVWFIIFVFIMGVYQLKLIETALENHIIILGVLTVGLITYLYILALKFKFDECTQKVLDKLNQIKSRNIYLTVVWIVLILTSYSYLFQTYGHIQDKEYTPMQINVSSLTIGLKCLSLNTDFITDDSRLICTVSAKSIKEPFNKIEIIIHAFSTDDFTTPIFGCVAKIENVNSSDTAIGICGNWGSPVPEVEFRPEGTGNIKFKIYGTSCADRCPEDYKYYEGKYFYNEPLTVISENEERNIKNNNAQLVIAVFSIVAVLITEIFRFILEVIK